MLEQDLIKREIRYIEQDGKYFFNVVDIKDKTTDIFVKSKGITIINTIPYISTEYLRYKVELDYVMEKSLNLNNKI